MRRHSALYKAHLRSPEWAAIRQAALERAGHRCAFCGQTQNQLRLKGRHLEVHHNNYDSLGSEQPADLTVLCAGIGGCHAAADRQRRKANQSRTIRILRNGPGRVYRILPRRLRGVVRFFAVSFVLIVLAPIYLPWFGEGVLVGTPSCVRREHAVRIYLSKAKYPNVIAHIKESWREGHPHVLRINRKGADKRRERLLARWERRHPQPKGDGLDWDERPAAMLRRYAYKASMKPIPASENRSEGSRMRHALDGVCDGERVVYVFGP